MDYHIILFGAGASYGSEMILEKKPPLGNYLYPELVKSADTHYWKELPKELNELFLKENNFENAMDKIGRIWEKNNTNQHQFAFGKSRNNLKKGSEIDEFSSRLTNLQEEIAAYLSKFEISKDNIYNQIANSLKNKPNWKGALSTLNYDNLLDQALIKNNVLPATFNNCECFDIQNPGRENSIVYFFAGEQTPKSLEKFDNEKDNLFDLSEREKFNFSSLVEVCYPHGGCQFLVPITTSFKEKTASTFIGNMDNWQAVHLLPINQKIHTQIITPEIKKFYWFPIIAQYNSTKQSLSADYHIQYQKQRFQHLIQRADTITIIGVKYIKHDKHIWGSIMNSKAKKLIIEPGTWMGPKRNDIVIKKSSFQESINDILNFNDL